jgi:pSer/pThr/pTyr-binding forkhead associated (FHA) protein
MQPRQAAPRAARPASALARLSVMTAGRGVGEYQLREGRFIVGRTEDNDLMLDSKFVSRHHCQIINDRHESVLEDLNSTNGVYIAERRVRRHVLEDGDRIVIGNHLITYHDERTNQTEVFSGDLAQTHGNRQTLIQAEDADEGDQAEVAPPVLLPRSR